MHPSTTATTARWCATAALLLAAGAAQAHPGHGEAGFVQALAHPFLGLDHLLAMVATGVWSVTALPPGRRLAGPAVFVALLTAGVLLAWAGITLPGIEAGVALSVTLFGAMLLAGRRLAVLPGLMLVALAALLHGSAHGSELAGGAGMLATGLGIALGSALLHGAGLALGRGLAALPVAATRAAAAALGASGLLMLATRL